jgi:nitrite reductase/ring-hydroxylating ferredoxin subunit
MMKESTALTRRAVLAGGCGAACAVALTGCAGYGPGGPAPAPAPAPAPNPAGAPPAPAGGSAALVSTADVPVGGGVVLAAQGLVVTQPTAGTFKAFSATCTHQGCTVNQVAGGTINCPCHGSKFAVADGTPKAGPAKKPLPAEAVTVQGSSIVLA